MRFWSLLPAWGSSVSAWISDRSKTRRDDPARHRIWASAEQLEERTLLAAAIAPAEATETVQPPNIVLIYTDDQRADTLEYMPNVLSELAASGTTFENAFATTPLCCPSRASLLTGQYAHNHGVLTNNSSRGGMANFDDSETIATILQDAGYQTALFGKYLNEYPELGGPVGYIPPGWDEWVSLMSGGYFDYELIENGVLQSYGDAESDYITDVMSGKISDYILSTEANDAEPFFVFWSTRAPHEKSVPAPRHAGSLDGIELHRPPSFNEADMSDKVLAPNLMTAEQIAELDDTRQRQLETLFAVDEGVADILQTLQDTGELDNTIVIFTSDNGHMWGEHRFTTKGQVYEESIGVPLIVFDGRNPTTQVSDALALNIDLAPTFVELAGLPVQPEMDGESLVPLLSGDDSGWRTEALLETTLLKVNAVRSQNYLYVEYEDGIELYDLVNDPYQLESVHDSPAYASIVTDLAAKLQALVPDDVTGPLISNAAIDSPTVIRGNGQLELTLEVTDTATGNSGVRSPEYFIDFVGDDGDGIPMMAVDGYFDEDVEQVRSTLTTSLTSELSKSNFDASQALAGLAEGPHTIYVHARDRIGNWGPYVAIPFVVVSDAWTGDVSDVDPNQLTAFANLVAFNGATSDGQRELWISDGSSLGTLRLADLSGTVSANPSDLTEWSGELYFAASMPSGQRELYKSDGTLAGTRLLANLSGGVHSTPHEFTPFGQSLLFVATQADGQIELHISDGTRDGTTVLTDLSGGVSADPQDLTVVGDSVYFTAITADGQRELFVTDGTAGGTMLVTDLIGATSSDPDELTAFGDALYFTATTADGQRELHVSDGTAGGTGVLRDLSGATSSEPGELTVLADKLFFAATAANGQRELAASDGTSGGTTFVRNLGGTTSTNPTQLTAVGDTLFFVGTRPSGNLELFQSDGTVAGTFVTRDLFGANSANPTNLVAVGDTLFFTARWPDGQTELHQSDGTFAGTGIVQNLSGSANSNPSELTAVGDTLFFQATLENGFSELFISDGTSNGTLSVSEQAYRETGSGWADSALIGHAGTTVRESSNPNAKAQWEFGLPAGRYQVSLYRVVDGGNTPDAEVVISHQDGLATQSLNLTQGSSGWVDLGIFSFDGAGGEFVRLRNAAGSGKLVVDAVQFEDYNTPEISIGWPLGYGVTYTESAAAWPIAQYAVLTSPATFDFTGATLTADFTSPFQSGDRLKVNGGQSPGPEVLVGVSGANIIHENSVVVGTFSGGTSGQPLIITFNGQATETAVQDVLRHLTFHNVAATPSTQTRTVALSLADVLGGTSNVVSVSIDLRLLGGAAPLAASESGSPESRFASPGETELATSASSDSDEVSTAPRTQISVSQNARQLSPPVSSLTSAKTRSGEIATDDDSKTSDDAVDSQSASIGSAFDELDAFFTGLVEPALSSD